MRQSVSIARRLYTDIRSLARCSYGVSAVEFSVITPFLLLVLLAGADLGRFIVATQRVEVVASSIAQMLGETPVSTSATDAGDGVVTANDILFYYNSAMFTFPDALVEANSQGTNWWNLLSVNMASVRFVPTPATCTSNCTYTPKVVWALGSRVCGTAITSVSDTTAYSPTTLPADIFNSGSTIVVDVSYLWSPTIGSAYLPSITIQRSVYVTPRYVPIVEAQPNNGQANPCPNVL